MSKEAQSFDLPLTASAVQDGCRTAFTELNWDIVDDRPGLIAAREDITKLRCHDSPATATIEIGDSDRGSTLKVETRVAGFGPVASRHARGRHEAVMARIGHELRARAAAAT